MLSSNLVRFNFFNFSVIAPPSYIYVIRLKQYKIDKNILKEYKVF